MRKPQLLIPGKHIDRSSNKLETDININVEAKKSILPSIRKLPVWNPQNNFCSLKDDEYITGLSVKEVSFFKKNSSPKFTECTNVKNELHTKQKLQTSTLGGKGSKRNIFAGFKNFLRHIVNAYKRFYKLYFILSFILNAFENETVIIQPTLPLERSILLLLFSIVKIIQVNKLIS